MNALQTTRKNKKKGFTLVEIIVVLVIIAIMMAALAPVMIGWINDARETTVRTEGRIFMMAAQTVITEAEATGLWDDGSAYTTLSLDNDGLDALKAHSQFIDLVDDSALTTLVGLDPENPDYSDLMCVFLDGNDIPCGVVVENPIRGRDDKEAMLIGRRTDKVVGTDPNPIEPEPTT